MASAANRMMRRVASWTGASVLVMLSIAILAAQTTPDLVFREATETETVKGDLKAAIAQYERVVGMAGANRALAAQALVRMAECYQKLGGAEAQGV